MTREEAIELAIRACKETWNEKICKQIRKALESKTGHWTLKKDDDTWTYYECSECGHKDNLHYNYCPNCGAKMESQESEG